MHHIIEVQPITLSDGSTVYNVRIGNLDIPAIDEYHADALAVELANVISAHSNDTTSVQNAFNPVPA